MIMMRIKNLSLLIAVILLPAGLTGQKSDFGLWYQFSADHELVKGLRVEAEASLRTDNNASRAESWYFEPGLRYKFNKYFAAGIYYRFIEQVEKDDRFHARHRWFVQLKGDLPVSRFTFSARYRIQQQFKTYIGDPEDEIPVWSHRLRVELDYDIKSLPLTPYINAEIYNQVFAGNDIMVEKMRYMAGVEYTIAKRHTVGIEYVYQDSKVSKPAWLNAVSLNYAVKL